MKFQKQLLSFAILLAHTLYSFGDVIIFNNGQVLNGTVLQTNDSSVLFRREFGTFTYPQNEIKNIQKNSAGTNSFNPGTNRLDNWTRIVANLTKQPWAYSAKQIPATVIDKGVFQNVPYSSFRCGSNYELNIYGDPENPAAIEMGVYGGLLKDLVAKENCIEFIMSALTDNEDKNVVKKLERKQDIVEKGKFICEITPSTAFDAYGGWWISVYDISKVNAARASKAELAEICEPVIPRSISKFNPNDSLWSNDEKQQARVIQPIYTAPVVQTSYEPLPRTPSVSSGASYRPSSSYHPSSSGRVYVRGYTRKNGTYVQSHTRSSPRRR